MDIHSLYEKCKVGSSLVAYNNCLYAVGGFSGFTIHHVPQTSNKFLKPSAYTLSLQLLSWTVGFLSLEDSMVQWHLRVWNVMLCCGFQWVVWGIILETESEVIKCMYFGRSAQCKKQKNIFIIMQNERDKGHQVIPPATDTKAFRWLNL